MTKFEPGDVVAINSGGPAMTVSHQYGTRLYVTWFCGASLRECSLHASQVFPLDVAEPCQHLTLVTNNEI